jgi:hypothetical protein
LVLRGFKILVEPIKKFVSGGLFLAVITALLCLVSPGRADGATAIYYSVGTDTSALYSGNASASSGTLTLAGSAAAKIGVGDEIREGSNRYYITGRNSSTVFTLQRYLSFKIRQLTAARRAIRPLPLARQASRYTGPSTAYRRQ